MNISNEFIIMHRHRNTMNQERLSTLGESTRNMFMFSNECEDRLPLPTRSSSMRSNASAEKFRPSAMTKESPRRLHEDICLPPLMVPAMSSPPPPPVETKPEAPSFRRNLINVGEEELPLVGADETTHAHLRGETIDTCCIQCQSVLFCLRTATGVICPACRSISPTEGEVQGARLLGIGLTLEHVLQL
jgi:hypothetical protein